LPVPTAVAALKTGEARSLTVRYGRMSSFLQVKIAKQYLVFWINDRGQSWPWHWPRSASLDVSTFLRLPRIDQLFNSLVIYSSI